MDVTVESHAPASRPQSTPTGSAQALARFQPITRGCWLTMLALASASRTLIAFAKALPRCNILPYAAAFGGRSGAHAAALLNHVLGYQPLRLERLGQRPNVMHRFTTGALEQDVGGAVRPNAIEMSAR